MHRISYGQRPIAAGHWTVLYLDRSISNLLVSLFLNIVLSSLIVGVDLILWFTGMCREDDTDFEKKQDNTYCRGVGHSCHHGKNVN